ncbi:hypothetical protein ACOSQ2_002443 [Xanthoceras sorbifolium]
MPAVLFLRRTRICHGLERFVKVVPPICYVPSPLEDVLEVTSNGIPEEQESFVMGIVKEKSDKEKRVRSSTNKDNDHALEGPGAALDFGSAVGTDLPIPSTKVAGSSTFNEVPLSPILFLEKVLRKVLK